MFSNFVWGVILLLLGASLIIKTVFGISIPLVRIGLGIMCLYAGFTLITGASLFQLKGKTVKLKSEHIETRNPDSNYTIMLGSSTLDFSRMPMPHRKKYVKINNMFGSSHIILNRSIPTKIIGQAAFGSVTLPNDETISFAKKTYRNYRKPESPLLVIESTAAFGSSTIEMQ